MAGADGAAMPEELVDELEALTAIYGAEDLTVRGGATEADPWLVTALLRFGSRTVTARVTLPAGYPTGATAVLDAEWGENDGTGAVAALRDAEWMGNAVARAQTAGTLDEPHIFALLTELTAALESQKEESGVAKAAARRLEHRPTLQMPRSRWVQLNRTRVGDQGDRPINLERFLVAAEREITVALHKSGFAVNGKVTPVVEPRRFAKLCSLMRELDGERAEYAPLLTWHGTGYGCVDTIARDGYMNVGDIAPDGHIHGAKSGALWGEGVYSSTMPAVAAGYADIGNDGRRLMMVNLVLPGRLRVLSKTQRYTRQVFLTNTWQGTAADLKIRSVGVTAAQQRAQAAGELKENEFDTLATPNLDIIVSRNAEWVVPLFEVMLLPTAVPHPTKDLFTRGTWTYKPEASVCFEQIGSDALFAANFGEMEVPKSVAVQHIVLVSAAQAKSDWPFTTALAHYIGALSGKAHLFLAGSLSPWHEVSTSEQVHSEVKSAELASKKGRGLDGLVAEAVVAAVERIGKTALSAVGELTTIVYLVIPPEYSPGEKSELQRVLDEEELFMRPHNIIVKLIAVGQPAEALKGGLASAIGNVKRQLHTDVAFADEFAYPTEEATTYPEIFDAIKREVEHQDRGPRVRLSIPYPHGVVGEGFLVDLQIQPQWEMRVGPSRACLYQGVPPQLLLVNGVWHRGTVVRTDPPGPDPTKAMSKKKSKAAAKAQAAPSNLALPLSMIPLLAAYRNTVHGCKVRQSRHGTRVIQLGETAVEQLQRKIDRLASVPADLVSSATLEEARRTRTLLHGIHKLLVEIQCFDAVSFTGEFAAQLHDMKYFRRLAKRANATDLDNVAGTGLSIAALLDKLKQELGNELSCDPNAVPIDEPADALEFSRLDGLALTAVRSSASEIEPWLFLPTYVGTESVTVSQLYNARGGEDGRSRSGPSGKARDALEGSNGILLIGSPESLAARLTTAWTVTGNPYLHVPSQDLAVLCCSLWSLVESAFKICRLKDPDPVRVEGLLRAAVGLSERVSARMETWGWAGDLVARLAALESDADFTAPFTESHGVLSVCMVLSALLRADAAPVLSSKAYSRIVLALLGEAVSRSCRVCLRASGRSAGDFIQGALKRFPRKGAAMAGVGDVDMEESTRFTGRFFRNRKLTNCTAYAVVAGLEFIERIHAGAAVATIIADFVRHTVSMKGWIQRHGGGVATGREFQLALFLQGMKFHTSLTRQTLGTQIDPRAEIEARIKEEVAQKERKRAASAAATARRGHRRELRETLAASFAEYHTVPSVFTADEVAELNRARPKWDQLERLESGLLKHHCCYPKCPHYLQDLATADDRAKGTRKGLHQHLQYDMSVLGNYIPGFHRRAGGILARHADSTFEVVRKAFAVAGPHVARATPNSLAWKIPEQEELLQIYQAARTSASLADKTASSVAGRATVLAGELLADEDHRGLVEALLDAGSCDDPVVQAIHRGLCHSVFDPKTVTARGAIQKLWLCATGRCGPGKACEVAWLERNPPPMATLLEHVDRLTALSKPTEADKLKEFLWDALQKQPLRRPYRTNVECNRGGYSNDEPSFWALGYDTQAQMLRLAPRHACEAYLKRVAKIRAERRKRKKKV
eukprot:m.204472 g.204472  ORF g.204472 m.204472 type:complete len:1613 (+) comp15391_c0_seq1:66-4904(+)